MPFLLSFLAGLSTILGSFLIIFKKKDKIIQASLSFASGVMICVSLKDLLPESIKLMTFSFSNLIIYIALGLLIPYILNIFLDKKNEKTIYKLGIFNMIAIIIHNIPEGITTFLSAETNISLGIAISTAIALHNIPEGISVAVPIYYATGSKKIALKATLISGMSEPLGAALAKLFLSPYINNTILSIIFAITAGIMIYVSIFKLMPEALNYKHKQGAVTSFIIGIIIMLISQNLLN